MRAERSTSRSTNRCVATSTDNGVVISGEPDRSPRYLAGSLSPTSAVAMETGVMIGAGIFAKYTLQLFETPANPLLVPLLGAGLLLFAFAINVRGNRLTQVLTFLTALVKIGGISLLATAGLWLSGFPSRACPLHREN